MLTAYRFLRQDVALAVRADAIQPQIETEARNASRLVFKEILPRFNQPDAPAVVTTIVRGSRARLAIDACRVP